MSEHKFTYLVTDPCYLINHEQWSSLCSLTDQEVKEQGRGWGSVFRKMVQQHLQIISGDLNAVAGNTGYGDWSNEMHRCVSRDSVEIRERGFVADSGCVCVVEVTPSLLEYMRMDMETMKHFAMASIIESDTRLHGEIDESDPSWSMVSLYDEQGRLVAISEDSDADTEY